MLKGLWPKDILTLAQNSDLDKKKVLELIQENSLSTSGDWKKFMYYFLALCGFGLMACGVIFFFAYNWQELPGFVKFFVIISVLCISIGCSLYKKSSVLVKDLSVLLASILVGVLFGVYGQVYQTGANAYDLFIIWLLAISPWTLVSRFSFQWLFYTILANTCMVLWIQQISDKPDSLWFIVTSLLIVNALLYLIVYFHSKVLNYPIKDYYSNLFSFLLSYLALVGIGNFIFTPDIWIVLQKQILPNSFLLVLSCVWLIIQYKIAFKTKSTTKYALFILSILVVVLLVLLRVFDLSIISSLLFSVYCILAVLLLIKKTTQQKKIWQNES
ncbi:DUF2157 domain-containing protein [Myroides sp. LJL119]